MITIKETLKSPSLDQLPSNSKKVNVPLLNKKSSISDNLKSEKPTKSAKKHSTARKKIVDNAHVDLRQEGNNARNISIEKLIVMSPIKTLNNPK